MKGIAYVHYVPIYCYLHKSIDNITELRYYQKFIVFCEFRFEHVVAFALKALCWVPYSVFR